MTVKLIISIIIQSFPGAVKCTLFLKSKGDEEQS